MEGALDDVWRGGERSQVRVVLMHITHVNLKGGRWSHDLIMSLSTCLYFLMLAPYPFLYAIQYSLLLIYLLMAVFHSLSVQFLCQLLLVREGASMHRDFIIYASKLSV